MLPSLIYILAQVNGPPTEPSRPGIFTFDFFLVLIIFIVAWVFLIQRPRQKEEQEQAKKQENILKRGTKVVSIGGIHGKIVENKKESETVMVEVAKGVIMEFTRKAINPAPEKESQAVKKDDEENSDVGKNQSPISSSEKKPKKQKAGKA